jgi:hypothetical protein
MGMPRSRLWAFRLLATLVLGLPARTATADVITPDSIVRPPPGTLGSANFTPITSSSDLVTTQYAGLGLTFPVLPGPVGGLGATTAITNIGGTDVWAPASRTEAVATSVAVINYGNSITGQLARPTASLTVEFVGPGLGVLSAFDKSGNLLGTSFSLAGTGPHGGELMTVSAVDISSFTLSGPLLPLADIVPPFGLPWGMAEVDFTAVEAPEPGALTLCALGALGLVSCVRRRRRVG